MSERPRYEQPSLLPETRRLLRDVEERTRRPVEVRPDAAVRERGRAIYVVTDPDRSRHLVLYDPRHEPFVDHLVAHECGHIVRFADAKAEDQRVPVMSRERRAIAIRQLRPELTGLLRAGLPEGALHEVLPIWLSGTIAQISDTPSDIRIERWLWSEYPGLREAQRASLVDQVRTLHLVLRRPVEEVTPRSLWVASNAMNYALVSAVSEFLDRPDLLRPYQVSPSRRLGEELLAMVDATPDGGLATDRELSGRWAERLGFRHWPEWRALDALPAGFRHAWE